MKTSNAATTAFLSSSLACAAAFANLRGSSLDSWMTASHHRALDGSYYYSNITFCAQTSEKVDNDKYFWLTLFKEKSDDCGADIKGSCFLQVPGGTDKDTELCCTVDGTTQYNTDYDLSVSDPVTIIDRNSEAYYICGNAGGKYCPNYSWDDNEQGFAYFRIRDEDGNSLRKMSKFVCDDDCEGLTDNAGTCDSGAEEVYEHVHVGKSYCKESVITLSKYCDDHSGYTCENDHSYYNNMQICAKTQGKAKNDKYFWMFMTASHEDDDCNDTDPYGECLLTIPSGTEDSTLVCCTVETGVMTDSNDFYLQVTDPLAVTDGIATSSDYSYCGPDGGEGCPNYDSANNAQGFKYFKLKKENGDSIKKIDGFKHVESSCGLDDHNGSCDDYKKYEHVFVGTDYCLESSIQLKDGCAKYYCLDEDCS